MEPFVSSPWFRPVAFVVALLLYLPACYSWHAASLEPQPAPGHPKVVRLTLVSGERIVLHDAVFHSDTVTGVIGAGTRTEVLAVPSHDIRRAEFRGGVEMRDEVFVLVAALGLVAIAGAAAVLPLP